MAYTQPDNSGSLFRNERMREGKNDPTHTGSAIVSGIEYWISAWTKESQNGKKFFSFSFKPKEQRDQQPREQHQKPTHRPPPPPPTE
jgi:hypothetical protein